MWFPGANQMALLFNNKTALKTLAIGENQISFVPQNIFIFQIDPLKKNIAFAGKIHK